MHRGTELLHDGGTGGLPVLKVLFLFFTGRGSSFLSQKEKEKNGGANRTDRVVFGAAGNHKAVLFGGTGP